MSDDKRSGDVRAKRKAQSEAVAARNKKANDAQKVAIASGKKSIHDKRGFSFTNVDRRTGITHGAEKGVAFTFNENTGASTGTLPKNLQARKEQIIRNNPGLRSDGFKNKRAKQIEIELKERLDIRSKSQTTKRSQPKKFTGTITQKDSIPIKTKETISKQFTTGKKPIASIKFERNDEFGRQLPPPDIFIPSGVDRPTSSNTIPSNNQLLVSVPTQSEKIRVDNNFNALVNANRQRIELENAIVLEKFEKSKSLKQIRADQKFFIKNAKDRGVEFLAVKKKGSDQHTLVPIDQGFRSIIANPGAEISAIPKVDNALTPTIVPTLGGKTFVALAPKKDRIQAVEKVPQNAATDPISTGVKTLSEFDPRKDSTPGSQNLPLPESFPLPASESVKLFAAQSGATLGNFATGGKNLLSLIGQGGEKLLQENTSFQKLQGFFGITKKEKFKIVKKDGVTTRVPVTGAQNLENIRKPDGTTPLIDTRPSFFFDSPTEKVISAPFVAALESKDLGEFKNKTGVNFQTAQGEFATQSFEKQTGQVFGLGLGFIDPRKVPIKAGRITIPTKTNLPKTVGSFLAFGTQNRNVLFVKETGSKTFSRGTGDFIDKLKDFDIPSGTRGAEQTKLNLIQQKIFREGIVPELERTGSFKPLTIKSVEIAEKATLAKTSQIQSPLDFIPSKSPIVGIPDEIFTGVASSVGKEQGFIFKKDFPFFERSKLDAVKGSLIGKLFQGQTTRKFVGDIDAEELRPGVGKRAGENIIKNTSVPEGFALGKTGGSNIFFGKVDNTGIFKGAPTELVNIVREQDNKFAPGAIWTDQKGNKIFGRDFVKNIFKFNIPEKKGKLKTFSPVFQQQAKTTSVFALQSKESLVSQGATIQQADRILKGAKFANYPAFFRGEKDIGDLFRSNIDSAAFYRRVGNFGKAKIFQDAADDLRSNFVIFGKDEKGKFVEKSFESIFKPGVSESIIKPSPTPSIFGNFFKRSESPSMFSVSTSPSKIKSPSSIFSVVSIGSVKSIFSPKGKSISSIKSPIVKSIFSPQTPKSPKSSKSPRSPKTRKSVSSIFSPGSPGSPKSPFSPGSPKSPFSPGSPKSPFSVSRFAFNVFTQKIPEKPIPILVPLIFGDESKKRRRFDIPKSTGLVALTTYNPLAPKFSIKEGKGKDVLRGFRFEF